MLRPMLLLLAAATGLCAQTHPIQAMIDAARAKSPDFKDLLAKYIPNRAQGTVQVWGQDYLFAIDTDKPATVSVDMQPAIALARVPDTNLWYRIVKMRTGVTHAYQFYADAK